MGTDENLQAAFAGESQANRKYTAFSRKAEQEGFANIAKLFKAAAEAETVHALSHLRTMKQVGSTNENLKTALEGEVHEHTKMYPEFIKEAEGEPARCKLIDEDFGIESVGIRTRPTSDQ